MITARDAGTVGSCTATARLRSLTEVDPQRGAQRIDGFLRVLAALSGDRFPNAEMFVTDGRGKARMLLTYETMSGALSGPAYASSSRAMSTSSMS